MWFSCDSVRESLSWRILLQPNFKNFVWLFSDRKEERRVAIVHIWWIDLDEIWQEVSSQGKIEVPSDVRNSKVQKQETSLEEICLNI